MQLLKKQKNFLKSEFFIIRALPYIVCAFILLCVLTTSVVYYSYLKKQAIDTYYYFSLNMLEKLKTDTETQKKSVKNLCIQTTFNSDINKLFYNSIDAISLLGAKQVMKNYASFVDSIDSINVYNAKNQTLYTPFEDLVTDNYEKIPFEKMKSNIPYTFNEFLYKSNDISSPNKVIYSYSMENSNDFIIVDTNCTKLNNLFLAYQKDNKAQLYVSNKNNQFLYSGGRFEFASTADKNFMSLINKNENYKILEIDRQKFMGFSLHSSATDYTFTTLIPYNMIVKSMVTQRSYYYFIITLFFLILVVVISILFSIKIKLPINTMLSKLSHYKTYEYNKKIKKMREALKTYLSTPFPSSHLLSEAYSNLECYLNKKNDAELFLICLSIDNFEKFSSENSKENQDALKYGISNICEETLNKTFKCISIFDTDKTIILIAIDTNTTQKTKQIQMLSECIKLVQMHLDISLTISVSDKSDFGHLPELYEIIGKINNYRYIYGYNVIMYPEIIRKDEDSSDESKEILKTLITVLNNNDFEQTNVLVSSFINSLKILTNEKAHSFVMKFLIFFIDYVDKIRNQQLFFGNINEISFMNAVNKSETLDNVEQNIKIELLKIESNFFQKENDKYKNIAKKVTELINDNFSDINFCADSIASDFNLSTVYINRIYKQQTGTTLSNVILNTRMQYATKLLKNTNVPIKDISLQAGFINNSYFIVIFKKEFGYTPATYRNKFSDGYTI